MKNKENNKAMFVKAIKICKQAMFPIFLWRQLSPQQAQVGVAGAGFFINSRGYFVSVAHIFDSRDNQTSFRYWGLLPDNLVNPFLEINEILRDDNNDIYVGRIDIKNQKYFYLSKKIPDIGRSVCIAGYPLAQISINQSGGPELGGVRRYIQPSFVLDYVVANSDNGLGRIRRHDGFLVRDFGLFGMSGGPIFDTSGKVVGVQASITPPRISEGPNGRRIIVENAVAIRSNLILDFLKRNQIKTNFLGKF